MSTPTLSAPAPRSLRIGGHEYPILLPKLKDPRLHLAFTITSLQVLGQTAFGFQLSIAQILTALLTCAVLELAITFHRQRVIMWPASALLTGNGVAFVLRVPGTEHGDWWSMNGWWIYAGTAAIALLSKHLVTFRGQHFLNPSNFGLVVCFLVLGPGRADPLALWWGPMSLWMALALAIIAVGAAVILTRLHLVAIAVTFWVTFALGIGVIAASGHQMTARWHLGPITGLDFWRVLMFSPEVLIFLFFMITDPKTIPAGRTGRKVYAVSVALLATLLIAPTVTEFWTKVALLGALTAVCAVRPFVELLAPRLRAMQPGRAVLASAGIAGATAFAALLVLAGAHARPDAALAASVDASGPLPEATVLPSKGVSTQIDAPLARRITADLVADLQTESEAMRTRDRQLAAQAAGSTRLQAVWRQIAAAAGKAIVVPQRQVDAVQLQLQAAVDQAPPLVLATITGSERLVTWEGTPAAVAFRGNATPFTRTLELQSDGGRYLIVGSRGGTPEPIAGAGSTAELVSTGVGGARLQDVAAEMGVDFRQQSFRTAATADVVGMMGGGVCWLDANGDGRLDLYAVNSYSDLDTPYWRAHGGMPRNALYLNEGTGFRPAGVGSGADVQMKGNGCVAADLNGDGAIDLFVTAAGYDALLWNDGEGQFTEGATAAGIDAYGWHSGATVGDVNGDGRPDVFVAGYTDWNAPIPSSDQGFPNDHLGVRDLLYLNVGNDAKGHARFREVGQELGVDRRVERGLGAVFSDVNGDGRLDLLVANDANSNRLYVNLPYRGGAGADPLHLGFRLEERAAQEGMADTGAGMGVAPGDYSGDGRTDLLVTNSHKQLHAVYRSVAPAPGKPLFEDARADIAPAFDTSLAGWGVSWVDLDNDGHLDLVLANGAIPVTGLARSAEPVQAFENMTAHGHPGQFAAATSAVALSGVDSVNGRGVAAADFDDDGRVDLAVNTIGGKLLLLRNTGARGHWLTVALPRFAPGAVVTAVLPDGRRLVDEIHAGSSYLSSEDPRAHFGLGKETKVAELTVRYPDGRRTHLRGVPADQVVTLG